MGMQVDECGSWRAKQHSQCHGGQSNLCAPPHALYVQSGNGTATRAATQRSCPAFLCCAPCAKDSETGSKPQNTNFKPLASYLRPRGHNAVVPAGLCALALPCCPGASHDAAVGAGSGGDLLPLCALELATHALQRCRDGVHARPLYGVLCPAGADQPPYLRKLRGCECMAWYLSFRGNGLRALQRLATSCKLLASVQCETCNQQKTGTLVRRKALQSACYEQ